MTLCRHVRAVAWKQDHSASSVLICSTSRVWRPSPYNRIPAELTGVEPIITVFLYLIWRRFDMMTKRLQTNLHLWLGLARWQVIFFSTGIMIIKQGSDKRRWETFWRTIKVLPLRSGWPPCQWVLCQRTPWELAECFWAALNAGYQMHWQKHWPGAECRGTQRGLS